MSSNGMGDGISSLLKVMADKSKKISIWDAKIIRRAMGDSFVKLNPRTMMKNPVMFVVEVGSVLATLQFIRGIVSPTPGVTNTSFELQITPWRLEEETAELQSRGLC